MKSKLAELCSCLYRLSRIKEKLKPIPYKSIPYKKMNPWVSLDNKQIINITKENKDFVYFLDSKTHNNIKMPKLLFVHKFNIL